MTILITKIENSNGVKHEIIDEDKPTIISNEELNDYRKTVEQKHKCKNILFTYKDYNNLNMSQQAFTAYFEGKKKEINQRNIKQDDAYNLLLGCWMDVLNMIDQMYQEQITGLISPKKELDPFRKIIDTLNK